MYSLDLLVCSCRVSSLTTPFCRTGVKKIRHPSMAKVPVDAMGAEADPSKTRKADDSKVPTEGAKKVKGDEAVTISDKPVDAPRKALTRADAAVKAVVNTGSQQVEPTALVGVAGPSTSA